METPALFSLFVGLFAPGGDNSPLMVDARRADAVALVGSYFDGATFSGAIGMWKGASEPTLVVSLLGTMEQGSKVRALAAHIAHSLAQDCVAVSVAPLSSVDYVRGVDHK